MEAYSCEPRVNARLVHTYAQMFTQIPQRSYFHKMDEKGRINVHLSRSLG